MSWFVYIIRSSPGLDRLYCGVSPEPERRLRKHNGELLGGAKATRAGRPWSIVYIEGPMTKVYALRREFRIKKLTRRAKLALIGVSPQA